MQKKKVNACTLQHPVILEILGKFILNKLDVNEWVLEMLLGGFYASFPLSSVSLAACSGFIFTVQTWISWQES